MLVLIDGVKLLLVIRKERHLAFSLALALPFFHSLGEDRSGRRGTGLTWNWLIYLEDEEGYHHVHILEEQLYVQERTCIDFPRWHQSEDHMLHQSGQFSDFLDSTWLFPKPCFLLILHHTCLRRRPLSSKLSRHVGTDLRRPWQICCSVSQWLRSRHFLFW